MSGLKAFQFDISQASDDAYVPILEYSFAFGLLSGRWLYRHPSNESYSSAQLFRFSVKVISHAPRSAYSLFSLTSVGKCNSEIKYLITKNPKENKILIHLWQISPPHRYFSFSYLACLHINQEILGLLYFWQAFF